jgi:hypothetical protein
MTTTRIAPLIVLSAVLASPLPTWVAPARGEEDARPLSPAQTALFESNHLDALKESVRLDYAFRQEHPEAAADEDDRVELDVRPRADGAKDVWVDFLSGDRHVPFPPVIGFHGNPIVMFYLERDVGEMHRRTGGAAAYFRNRIREAFVDRAQVRPIELTYGGQTVAASEIILRPFVGDQRLAGATGLDRKLYRFVLSDAIPGTVYLIGSEIPGEAGTKPLLRETLTFAAELPCSGAEGPCAPSGAR